MLGGPCHVRVTRPWLAGKSRFASPGTVHYRTGPDAPKMDFVFTVCDNAANEVCPIWPGQPMTAHWGVPDPAAVEGTEEVKQKAFLTAFMQLQTRITLFLSLPMKSLDRLSLQQKIRDIGKTTD